MSCISLPLRACAPHTFWEMVSVCMCGGGAKIKTTAKEMLRFYLQRLLASRTADTEHH